MPTFREELRQAMLEMPNEPKTNYYDQTKLEGIIKTNAQIAASLGQDAVELPLDVIKDHAASAKLKSIQARLDNSTDAQFQKMFGEDINVTQKTKKLEEQTATATRELQTRVEIIVRQLGLTYHIRRSQFPDSQIIVISW